MHFPRLSGGPSSLRRKLLLFCLLLLLLPISLVGYFSYDTAKQETTLLIENSLRNNVKLVAEQIRSFEEAVRLGALTREEAQEKMKVLLLGAKQDGKRPINHSIDLGPNGYFFVLDESGNAVAHPLLEGQNILDKQAKDGAYFIRDLIGQAKNGGGFTYYYWPLPDSETEALKVAYSVQESEWGWVLAAGSYMQDYNGGQTRILQAILVTLGICLAAGSVLVLLFAGHIAAPLRRLADSARSIADGRLSSPPPAFTRRDEIGQLADAFGVMQRSLRDLVAHIHEGSAHLSSMTRQLYDTIQQVTGHTETISESVHGISEAAAHQSLGVQDCVSAMEEMVTGIGQMASASSLAQEASVRTAAESQQGHRLMQQSADSFHTLYGSLERLSGVIASLEERSQQIGSMADVIGEISAQTNLLSLNASIEAARAGEAGRGFSVVASEVKKLAERSSASAKEVSALIAAVQDDIRHAAHSMQASVQQARSGAESVRQSEAAFGRILEAAQGVLRDVGTAASASEQMTAGSQEISASLQGVRHTAESSAAAVSGISQSAEGQLASMEEITASAESISGLAERLRQSAHRFSL